MRSENREVLIDTKTLRESSTEELEGALQEAKERLHTIKSEAAVGATRCRPDYRKPHLVKGYRKLIARIETILREHQI